MHRPTDLGMPHVTSMLEELKPLCETLANMHSSEAMASWDSKQNKWTLVASQGAETETHSRETGVIRSMIINSSSSFIEVIHDNPLLASR